MDLDELADHSSPERLAWVGLPGLVADRRRWPVSQVLAVCIFRTGGEVLGVRAQPSLGHEEERPAPPGAVELIFKFDVTWVAGAQEGIASSRTI